METEFSAWHMIAALGLVALNAFFVASEFAIVKVRRTRLAELADAGNASAKVALTVTADVNSYLTANQLGITLASLALGWIGEPAVAGLLWPLLNLTGVTLAPEVARVITTIVSFIVVMFLHTVLGELVPKSAAILHSDTMAIHLARPLHLFYRVTYPIIWLFNSAANVFSRMLGMDPNQADEQAHSVEELRMIVWATRQSGELDPITSKLMTNLLDYRDRTAREVMTPRNDIVTLDPRKSVADCFAQAIGSHYTRFPVYHPVDQKILGYVHIRDLVRIHLRGTSNLALFEIMRDIIHVPEGLHADIVRRQLQEAHTHVAAVIDEFGDFAGIVTMEDLLEQIFGQIQDELDQESPMIAEVRHGEWEIDAGLLLDAAEEDLGVEWGAEPEGQDTVAGYIMYRLGRVAQVGDAVTTVHHRFEVTEMEGIRIVKVRVTLKDPHTQTV